jgi:CubicO group peptidase (beta-lactamase class C family)
MSTVASVGLWACIGIIAATTASAQATQPMAASPAQQAVPDSRMVSARIDELFKPWSSSATPGCAVGVAHNGRTVSERAYGSADLEHSVANGTETVFEAGSSSKQFTAAAVLLLAQQHKLFLSDDIRKYLPELPRYEGTITVDQLLNHTSGLRDWGEIELIAGWPRTTRAYTMTDVLGVLAAQQALNHQPAAQYSYTNSGYNLLALIVERVSKQSLAQFTRQQLFLPLGMTHTQWRDDFRRIVKNRAIAYARVEDGYVQEMPFEDTYGHAGLLTTVGDLLKWNQALADERLGKFVTQALQQPAVLEGGAPSPMRAD